MTKVEGNSFSFRHPYGILYRGTVDGWQAMGDGHFGWSFKDGVLSNRIKRDAAGKRVGGDVNLISKRADIFDFTLSYDVCVPKSKLPYHVYFSAPLRLCVILNCLMF